MVKFLKKSLKGFPVIGRGLPDDTFEEFHEVGRVIEAELEGNFLD